MDLKSLFYKRFADLPISLRGEIIVVVENQPLTWNVLKIEVDEGTEVADKALLIMSRLGILVEDKNLNV